MPRRSLQRQWAGKPFKVRKANSIGSGLAGCLFLAVLGVRVTVAAQALPRVAGVVVAGVKSCHLPACFRCEASRAVSAASQWQLARPDPILFALRTFKGLPAH